MAQITYDFKKTVPINIKIRKPHLKCGFLIFIHLDVLHYFLTFLNFILRQIIYKNLLFQALQFQHFLSANLYTEKSVVFCRQSFKLIHAHITYIITEFLKIFNKLNFYIKFFTSKIRLYITGAYKIAGR